MILNISCRSRESTGQPSRLTALRPNKRRVKRAFVLFGERSKRRGAQRMILDISFGWAVA